MQQPLPSGNGKESLTVLSDRVLYSDPSGHMRPAQTSPYAQQLMEVMQSIAASMHQTQQMAQTNQMLIQMLFERQLQLERQQLALPAPPPLPPEPVQPPRETIVRREYVDSTGLLSFLVAIGFIGALGCMFLFMAAVGSLSSDRHSAPAVYIQER